MHCYSLFSSARLCIKKLRLLFASLNGTGWKKDRSFGALLSWILSVYLLLTLKWRAGFVCEVCEVGMTYKIIIVNQLDYSYGLINSSPLHHETFWLLTVWVREALLKIFAMHPQCLTVLGDWRTKSLNVLPLMPLGPGYKERIKSRNNLETN